MPAVLTYCEPRKVSSSLKTEALVPVLSFVLSLLLLATAVSANPPEPHDGIGKTLKLAGNHHKMALIVLGRESCSYCRVFKKHITDGDVSITAREFVWADLNADDPKAKTAFKERFHKETFGDSFPWVVITNSEGKVLATWSGGRKAPGIEKQLSLARGQMNAH